MLGSDQNEQVTKQVPGGDDATPLWRKYLSIKAAHDEYLGLPHGDFYECLRRRGAKAAEALDIG